MSELEKKASHWPWILVPVAAVTLFFVLRECRQNIPPAERASPTGTAVEPMTAEPMPEATPPAPPDEADSQ